MAIWKIWSYDDSAFLDQYEADSKDDSTKNRSYLACPPKAVHLQVPDGAVADACVYVSDAGVAASGAYETVTYTNTVIGEAGEITVTFDGVKTIAEIATEYGLTHDAGDDSVVPGAGSVDLTGGLEPERLEEDAAELLVYKKAANQAAREAKIAEEEATCDAGIHTLVDKTSPETQLMLAANNLFEYLKALQTAASILDGDMTQAGQDAKTALTDMQTTVMGGAQTYRSTRDTNIADTASYYPYPSDGLPDGYSDDYTE
jgi:hypothetical protein